MNLRKTVFLLPLLVGLQACDKPVAGTPGHTADGVGQAASEPAAKPAPQAAIDVERTIAEAMTGQYPGARDEKHNCWVYAHGAGEAQTEYCMRPGPGILVDGRAGKMLYFLASNATDINDDLRFAYDGADSGLMGAFQLSIAADGRWKTVAAEPGMDFGSAGNCGCESAEFVRLGADYYGWKFTSGGMWQGVIVSNHEIVAPHDGRFKNLSAIPEIREEAQDVRYRIELIDSDAAREVFPLRVEKMQEDKKVGERTLEFDRENWMYPEVNDL